MMDIISHGILDYWVVSEALRGDGDRTAEGTVIIP
jgi:hypothetical protein